MRAKDDELKILVGKSIKIERISDGEIVFVTDDGTRYKVEPEINEFHDDYTSASLYIFRITYG